MFRTKSLAGILLIMAVLFAQVGSALAAPAAQDATPIAGTVQEIEIVPTENGETTVLVTVEDESGMTQTVRISLDTAVGLNLVSVNQDTQEVTIIAQPDQPVVIDPTLVIPDEEEADVHPIAAILGTFFGVEGSVVQEYHEDGFGFGVIAQAMWISQNVNGDASVTGLILQAKESGDYGNILLSDGTTLTMEDGTAPQNWGQFKKALLDKKNNLGVIVSGQADSPVTGEELLQQQNGNGNGNGRGNGNGNGNGHGKDNNPGRGNGNNQ